MMTQTLGLLKPELNGKFSLTRVPKKKIASYRSSLGPTEGYFNFSKTFLLARVTAAPFNPTQPNLT